MTRELVFVHGRAQEHKDSVALKKEWIDAWETGLAKSGLANPLQPTDIHFPYYGDTLDQLVRGVAGDKVADVIVRGAAGADQGERQAAQAVERVLAEVQRRNGIADADIAAEVEAMQRAEGAPIVVERGILNNRWVQALLRVIDRRIPNASAASIALATRDVFKYMTNPGLAAVIDQGVTKAIRPGVETVVVAHSLGTVVAYMVLKRDGARLGWRIPSFITVGSPLAVSDIRARITPYGRPACVGAWFNAMDPNDVVSLYPLDEANFPGVKPLIENKTDVDNRTPNQHGISGYLSDPVVAKRIFDAVTA